MTQPDSPYQPAYNLMKRIFPRSLPVVALGTAIAVVSTLLHYAQAHRASAPGGYFAIYIGALGFGILAGTGDYFSTPTALRIIRRSIAVAALISLTTAGIFMATLIWAYGS